MTQMSETCCCETRDTVLARTKEAISLPKIPPFLCGTHFGCRPLLVSRASSRPAFDSLGWCSMQTKACSEQSMLKNKHSKQHARFRRLQCPLPSTTTTLFFHGVETADGVFWFQDFDQCSNSDERFHQHRVRLRQCQDSCRVFAVMPCMSSPRVRIGFCSAPDQEVFAAVSAKVAVLQCLVRSHTASEDPRFHHVIAKQFVIPTLHGVRNLRSRFSLADATQGVPPHTSGPRFPQPVSVPAATRSK